MSKRSTRAKDPENDKRKLTWKTNLSKAHQKQKEMKETYENQKLKELEIYDSSSDSNSDYDYSSSESEEEFVIKPKKTKAKSKPKKVTKNSVLEELRAMREEVNKLRREKEKANKKSKNTVIQVMPSVTDKKDDSIVNEMKRKALVNF